MKAELTARQGKPTLTGMLLEPSEQFRRMRQHPRFGGALTGLLLISGVLGALTGWKLAEHPAYREQLSMMGDGAQVFMAVNAAVGVLVAIPVTIALTSLFQWLFMLFFQGEASYRQLFSMNTYLSVLPLLASLISTIVLLITGGGADPEVVPTSLAALIPAEGALKGLLGGIEVFAVWKLILSATGLAILGRISRGKAWTIALILFGLGLGLAAGAAELGEMFNPSNNR